MIDPEVKMLKVKVKRAAGEGMHVGRTACRFSSHIYAQGHMVIESRLHVPSMVYCIHFICK